MLHHGRFIHDTVCQTSGWYRHQCDNQRRCKELPHGEPVTDKLCGQPNSSVPRAPQTTKNFLKYRKAGRISLRRRPPGSQTTTPTTTRERPYPDPVRRTRPKRAGRRAAVLNLQVLRKAIPAVWDSPPFVHARISQSVRTCIELLVVLPMRRQTGEGAPFCGRARGSRAYELIFGIQRCRASRGCRCAKDNLKFFMLSLRLGGPTGYADGMVLLPRTRESSRRVVAGTGHGISTKPRYQVSRGVWAGYSGTHS